MPAKDRSKYHKTNYVSYYFSFSISKVQLLYCGSFKLGKQLSVLKFIRILYHARTVHTDYESPNSFDRKFAVNNTVCYF